MVEKRHPLPRLGRSAICQKEFRGVILNTRHTGRVDFRCERIRRLPRRKEPSVMASYENLGLTTSSGRVDQCSRVCTQGVQSIRPGVLRSTSSFGCGSPVGTAHGLLSDTQRYYGANTSLSIRSFGKASHRYSNLKLIVVTRARLLFVSRRHEPVE